jgi:phosphatidylserine decarboxylase
VTIRSSLLSIARHEDVNFLLTNRIPRRLLTQFMGWFSQIEQPLVRDVSLAAWRMFADLELDDAARSEFRSMHDCFTRELRAGARPLDLDPAVLVSPCDAIVGASGEVQGTRVFQAKGYPYDIAELLGDAALVEQYRDARYVTLRLTSAMYHRFHAPHDCQIERVRYISGDTWNTNPIALRRVEKLFCKNERAVLRTRLESGHLLTLVPVASILISSIRLHCLDALVHEAAPDRSTLSLNVACKKGEELGYFQHGSTIIVFAPKAFELCPGVVAGKRIRMGGGLLRLTAAA